MRNQSSFRVPTKHCGDNDSCYSTGVLNLAEKPYQLLLIAFLTIAGSGACPADTLNEIMVTTGQRPVKSAKLPTLASIIGEQGLDTVVPIYPSKLLSRVVGVNTDGGSGQEHLTVNRSRVLTGGADAGSFLYSEDGILLAMSVTCQVKHGRCTRD